MTTQSAPSMIHSSMAVKEKEGVLVVV